MGQEDPLEKEMATQSSILAWKNWEASVYGSQRLGHDLATEHTCIFVTMILAAAAKSLQSCPTLCNPIPGILQARTLEWVTISFSNA